MTPDEEPSLNIPSLLTLAVVSFFVIRWFLNRDEPGAGGSRARGNGVDPAQVAQISQMFPQLGIRDIAWDLQRNGGNVAATTERILIGRGLEVPPPSFQPQINLPTGTTAPPPPATSATAPKPNAQDLISRYNLASKVSGDSGAGETAASTESKNAWSQNKDERQRLLQKRRDDMILAARKRMMQKVMETDQ